MHQAPLANKVKIELDPPFTGDIEFSLIFNDFEFNSTFDSDDDPFVGLKSWLEALAVGADEASFSYDYEEVTYFWRLKKVIEYYKNSYDLEYEILEISQFYKGKEELIFFTPVNRRQMVFAIYFGVSGYSNSDEYLRDKKSWEGISYTEFLMKDFNVSEDELFLLLLNYSKIEIKDILFKINYERDKHTDADFNEVIKKNLKRYIAERIPEQYDALNDKNRKYILKRFLNRKYSYGAEKLYKFESEIVERYLNFDD